MSTESTLHSKLTSITADASAPPYCQQTNPTPWVNDSKMGGGPWRVLVPLQALLATLAGIGRLPLDRKGLEPSLALDGCGRQIRGVAGSCSLKILTCTLATWQDSSSAIRSDQNGNHCLEKVAEGHVEEPQAASDKGRHQQGARPGNEVLHVDADQPSVRQTQSVSLGKTW